MTEGSIMLVLWVEGSSWIFSAGSLGFYWLWGSSGVEVSASGGMEWLTEFTPCSFPRLQRKERIQLPQPRNISAVMSKEAQVPSKSLEKGMCALFLSLYPVSHSLTFLLQFRLSKWRFLRPFPMPVHLEQHRLPIPCSGAVSGTSFCSLLKS